MKPRFNGLMILNCVFLVFSLADCGGDHKMQGYAYEWSVNGCTTGRHEFTSMDAMCTSLQDETFNNGCALAQRSEYFHHSCSGQFKPAVKSYTFNTNGCDTHRHGFHSQEAMCRALQNDQLNHGCALDQREAYFKQQCPGTFRNLNGAKPSRAIRHLTSNLANNSFATKQDCAGFVITVNGEVIAIESAEFPSEIPEHSSIVLGCSQK